jgi:oxalate decarboxylase/phosphoglucose isomerase-like protein (cupin superfamily)
MSPVCVSTTISDWAMSAFLVRLEKGGVLEPHWHPNAAELGYCIGGRAEMTIYPSNADADSFTVHTFTIDPVYAKILPLIQLYNRTGMTARKVYS